MFSLPAGTIKNWGFRKLLRVTSEEKLNFDEGVTSLYNKADKNIQVLIRIFPCVLQTHKRLLMNGYLMSQVGYYPLVWINHSRILNKCIKELHKINFSLLYKKFTVSFFWILEEGKSVTINIVKWNICSKV